MYSIIDDKTESSSQLKANLLQFVTFCYSRISRTQRRGCEALPEARQTRQNGSREGGSGMRTIKASLTASTASRRPLIDILRVQTRACRQLLQRCTYNESMFRV